MFEFTETVTIDAPSSTVWEHLQDLEEWWPASNPEHESLELLDDRGIRPGARIRIRERIAGVPGEAVGEITHVDAGTSVTWEAPAARYRWLGLPSPSGKASPGASSPRPTRPPGSAHTSGRPSPRDRPDGSCKPSSPASSTASNATANTHGPNSATSSAPWPTPPGDSSEDTLEAPPERRRLGR
ncbi:hypothetical protein E1293_00070 [Actinomadura darangshiensis]|uniref:Uncharacterized protein n=1 Tax=Actinomadura darangshiensis TaxID=705336 RepID=A0A4R5C036_9ACTN|nr:hypothetical protein E1293_00070 [Actinomadura darangshiensis]